LQGFGVTARSTAEVRRLDPTGITTFRQADVGEYLRDVCIQFKFRIYILSLTFRRKIRCFKSETLEVKLTFTMDVHGVLSFMGYLVNNIIRRKNYIQESPNVNLEISYFMGKKLGPKSLVLEKSAMIHNNEKNELIVIRSSYLYLDA
jgi:hypothetical protein